MKLTVYVVCEYPHEPADEVHRISLVTADRAEAEKAAQPDYQFFVEAHEIDVFAGEMEKLRESLKLIAAYEDVSLMAEEARRALGRTGA